MSYKQLANFSNLGLSAVCQVLAFPLSQFTSSIWPSIYSFLLFHSVIAFLIASFLKLPAGWKIFNLLIVPAVIIYEASGLPSYILLAAFALSYLIYLPTFWTRVPYYPTSTPAYEVISSLIPTNKNIRFHDIGCGFSSLLVYLAAKHPSVTFEGSEISPLAYFISKLRSLYYPNLSIKFKSFWKIDFSHYDIVYAFLAPPPMEKLWAKVKSEMKPGSIFLSNSFEVPAKPDKAIEINDKRKCRIMLHEIK